MNPDVQAILESCAFMVEDPVDGGPIYVHEAGAMIALIGTLEQRISDLEDELRQCKTISENTLRRAWALRIENTELRKRLSL